MQWEKAEACTGTLTLAVQRMKESNLATMGVL